MYDLETIKNMNAPAAGVEPKAIEPKAIEPKTIEINKVLRRFGNDPRLMAEAIINLRAQLRAANPKL